MKWFLGVDGGQSGTTALIANEEGDVLGRGTAGSCNHVSSAEARAKLARVIRECVNSACLAAGLDREVHFESACFGMSGGPTDKAEILRASVPAAQIMVTDDAVIALTGALEGAPGVITIAGTGSIALARGPEGDLRRAGGWGYVFGDEGSAFDIVRQALRASLRAEEGWGASTRLADRLLCLAGCRTVNDALHLFYTPEWPRSRVAGLASVVDECAAAGDEIAVKILTVAAQNLALLTQSVRRQLWVDGELVRCSYVGGVFRSGLVLERYRALVDLGGCSVAPPAMGPAAGALIEAFRSISKGFDPGKLLSSKFRHD